MKQTVINAQAPGTGMAWPSICDRDAAAMRLEICRHLLNLLGDQPCHAPAAFAEVEAFLVTWTAESVHADPRHFCAEMVRVLGLMLMHMERSVPLTGGPAPVSIMIE